MQEFATDWWQDFGETPIGIWVTTKMPLAFLAGGWVLIFIILLLLLLKTDYKIGKKSVIITIFGFPVRWVSFDNIRTMHTRAPKLGEKWYNTMSVRYDRLLVIEKKRGILKKIVISPEQRYMFRSRLDRAIRQYKGMPIPNETKEGQENTQSISATDYAESGSPATKPTGNK